MFIKKNDMVKVISGNDIGKTGRVLKVFNRENKVIVEKVNFVKKHLKKGHPDAREGGILEKESPINISNVQLICSRCSKPTRVNRIELAEGEKVRKCKKCGEIIDKV